MPVLLAGTMNTLSKSPVNVKLTSHFNVSYCQTATPKDEVLVTIGLGDIKRTDSLYGFNFAVIYDRSKLYFNNKITVNTLSEFAEFSDVSFGLEKNKLFGAALSNTPLFGNKELIGFYGQYVGDMCNDSALVQVEYIEFTDEFQKNIAKLDTIWIKPKRAELNYKIYTNFTNEEHVYDSNNTNMIPVNVDFVNVKYLDYVGFKVRSENELFKLNYTNLNKDFIFSNIVRKEDSFELILQNLNSTNTDGNVKLFDIVIENENTATDTNSKIFIEPLQLSDCNCFDFTKVTSDSIRIKYIKDNTNTSVHSNDENLKLFYNEGNLSLNTENTLANHMQLFNSVGEIIIDENLINNSLNKNIKLSNGVYFALIWTNKQIISKKILVNN